MITEKEQNEKFTKGCLVAVVVVPGIFAYFIGGTEYKMAVWVSLGAIGLFGIVLLINEIMK